MQRNKILHFVSGLEVGGTETQLLRILPLLEEKFNNEVCCFNGNGPIGADLEREGIKVHYLHFKGRLDIAVFWRLGKVIRNFKPDIMITYLIHCDLIGRFWGRIFGIKKIICSQRGSLLQWEYLRFFDKLSKFLVTKYTVQTNTAKKELMKKLGASEDKFVVIPNGIDISKYNFEIDIPAKKNELGINPDNINIVCVSKLREGKGHEYLLEAFENIYRQSQKINLLIVGDGEKINSLRSQIASYKARNNIHFLGDRTDVDEILKISDIFALPTLGEGMSNAILEAMANSIPVITTDISANKDIIKNRTTGILVPIKDSNALCETIKILINNPEIRKRMGQEAKKEISKKYNTPIVVSKIFLFLENL